MELQHQSFSDGKRFACSRDPGSIPGLERSPGEGNGNPLQYFCLENSVEGRAWTATVHVDVTDCLSILHMHNYPIYICVYTYGNHG